MSDVAETSVKIYPRISPQDCAGLTVNDASAYGGWGTTTYTLLANGLIRAVKVRGRKIVLRQSIDDYLARLAKDDP